MSHHNNYFWYFLKQFNHNNSRAKLMCSGKQSQMGTQMGIKYYQKDKNNLYHPKKGITVIKSKSRAVNQIILPSGDF